MCLAQGHNTVTPVRLEPMALWSRVKHLATALPLPDDLTLFIPMDYPIHIDTISMDLSILYFMGSQVEISVF